MKPKDTRLDTAAEPNSGKYINFETVENNEEDPAGALVIEDTTPKEKQMTFDF